MKKLLVVVDMQKDFIDGSLGTKEAEAIVPNVQKKIEEKAAGKALHPGNRWLEALGEAGRF